MKVTPLKGFEDRDKYPVPAYEIPDALISKKVLQREKTRGYNIGPKNILPKMEAGEFWTSHDPEIVSLKIALANECTDAIVADLTENGFSLTGVVSDFGVLKTHADPMSRAVLPTWDNAILRREHGLTESWTCEEHKQIAYNVARLMFTNWVPNDLKIAKGSTSGFPRFISDADKKKQVFINQILPHIDEILTLISTGKLDQLWRRHKVVLLARISSRMQADGWIRDEDGNWLSPKGRKVPDLEYVLSNGVTGKFEEASKWCEEFPDLALARLRSVYGVPNEVNLMQAIFFEGHNKNITTSFPKMYSHHGADDITEKLKHFGDVYSTAVDVSDHDLLAPEFVYDVMFDVLREVWDDRVVDLFWHAARCPVACMNPEVYDEPFTFMMGNPFNPKDFKRWSGIMSGTYLVSALGKFGCTVQYLTLLHDIGERVLGNEEAWMSWRDPRSAALNMGDDSEMLFANLELKKKFDAYVEAGGNGMMKVGIDPQGFIGSIFVAADKTEKNIWAQSNPVSFLKNTLCRERGLGTFFSRFYVTGWKAKIRDYEQAKRGISEVLDIFRRLSRKHLGMDVWAAFNAHQDDEDERMRNLTDIESEVLMDPSKLLYKYDEKLVRPEIVNEFYHKVGTHEYAEIALQYYRGDVDKHNVLDGLDFKSVPTTYLINQ